MLIDISTMTFVPLKSFCITILLSAQGIFSYAQTVVFVSKEYPDGTLMEKYAVVLDNGDSIRKGSYSFYYPEGR
ncbi:MAG TPA: hypothetical protein PK632_04930, partial [Tenuifilaceae bacterium]|nr:hypothetical protein [Tenuifilaceae bacterium]